MSKKQNRHDYWYTKGNRLIMLMETRQLCARLTRHAAALRAADQYAQASDIEAALAIIVASPFARRVYRALHPLENGTMEHVPAPGETGEENEHNGDEENGDEGDGEEQNGDPEGQREEPEAVPFEPFRLQMLQDLAEFETELESGNYPKAQYMGDWFEMFAVSKGWM